MIITAGAARGLERCRRFLSKKSPEASRRAARTISKHLELLETAPAIGRPLEDQPELREMVISFGVSGYVTLYRHEPATDAVYVLAFRHQKEAGYEEPL